MKKAMILASAAMISIALLSGGAGAQGTPQTVELVKVDVHKLAAGYRASKVIGSSVVNDANETIGKIDDLLVSSDGKQPYAVLSVGGFLGMGTRLVVVPYDTLKFADNKVDPTTGTLRMWGIFQNPKLDLRPGLFVRVRMGVGEPRKALFVAESALGYDQGKQYLYVINDEKKAVYTPVEAGQRKDGLIAIISGLKGGELVVVNGLQRVRRNSEVAPKKVEMPRAKYNLTSTPVVNAKG